MRHHMHTAHWWHHTWHSSHHRWLHTHHPWHLRRHHSWHAAHHGLHWHLARHSHTWHHSGHTHWLLHAVTRHWLAHSWSVTRHRLGHGLLHLHGLLHRRGHTWHRSSNRLWSWSCGGLFFWWWSHVSPAHFEFADVFTLVLHFKPVLSFICLVNKLRFDHDFSSANEVFLVEEVNIYNSNGVQVSTDLQSLSRAE